MTSDGRPPGLALELLGPLSVREAQARRLEVLARRVPIVEATYGVVDGRTGLRLTRSAADEVLEARVAVEARPWAPADLVASTARPITLEALEAAIASLDEGHGIEAARWEACGRPLVPVPLEQTSQGRIHAGERDRGPASPPAPAPCSPPGSLGRHRVPDGTGVRSCPCGAVTRHPAS